MMIDFSRALASWIPAHKLRPTRMKFLGGLLQQLQQLFNDFCIWRTELRLLSTLSAQTLCLESFLNNKYGVTSIAVLSRNINYVAVGLEAEGVANCLKIGLETEGSVLYIPLSTDKASDFDVDFVCYAPSAINVEQLTADLEKYKLAEKTFKIIQR